MSKIIAIASGKGGVGKTLVTASLAVLLQRQECSVLAVDADMGLRNLDLLFGIQDDVLYDAGDVIKRRCSVHEALFPIAANLDFLAASQKHTWEKIDASAFQYLLEQLAADYDYLLVDCPPGRGKAYKDAVAVADQILFVVEPSWSSIRDASRVMQYCDKHKIFNYAVLLNNFYNNMPGFVSADQALSALQADQVAGLLPHDRHINEAVEAGTIVHAEDSTPFFRALRHTLNFLTQAKEISLPELKQYLPENVSTGCKADRSAENDEHHGAGTANAIPNALQAELKKAAAHSIPSTVTEQYNEKLISETTKNKETASSATEKIVKPSSALRLSLKQRRSQSRVWRQYHR